MANAVDDQRAGTTRLGSYEILRKLARGGMAEIFLARAVGPEGFEKLVVLKKILPQYAANPRFVKLFLDEAKLAAGFDHPHIAHVYDMGTVDGNYFFTMEYVHGQDVRSVLRRTDRSGKQLPMEHAVQVARNVAAALHYAHERRRPDGTLLDIVHRDVSPSNILVSYDGSVKLLDFGVAKAASSSVKTRTGTLKGKIAYMSPEQARGAAIDRRSDIYSLGIVLWEMVATRRLYKAENDLATIQLILNSEAPPPSVVRQDCPQELERIVLRALAYDVDRRYQSAEELQLDLEEHARENKLNQSSISLSRYMNTMFSAEIQAWLDAQASGITLTDHMIGASVSDLTTPVSAADLEIEDDVDAGDASEEDELPGIERAQTSRRPTAVPQEMQAVTAPMRPVREPRESSPPPLPAPAVLTLAAPPVTGPPPGFAAVPLSTSGMSSPGMSSLSGISSPGWTGDSRLSGSLPQPQRRSRAPWIAMAVLGVIVVGVGLGMLIARKDEDANPAAPKPQPEPQVQTPSLPPAPPPAETAQTPPPVETVTPPAPEPVAEPVPEPVPEPVAEPVAEPTATATATATAKKIRKPKGKPVEKRPVVEKKPVVDKKPVVKFDPNAALPPE